MTITVSRTGVTVSPSVIKTIVITAGKQGLPGATDYTQLTNRPSLGTAAPLDVAPSGNASPTQVVKGNDTRLSDARVASDVYAWAKAATQPSPIAHNQALATISDVTATAAEVNKLASLATTAAELGYVAGARSGLQAQVDDKALLTGLSRPALVENDCFYVGASLVPFSSVAIAGGNIVPGSISTTHPGTLLFRSSASANSGAWVGGFGELLLAGGETCEVMFYLNTLTNTVAYLGWHDSNNHAEPTDGVWLNINGATITGKAKNSAGPTTTATSYTLSWPGDWLLVKIALNADATLATFTLYDCPAHNVLWTDTVNANIPTAAGRNVSMRMTAFYTGTAEDNRFCLDWYRYSCSRVLAR